MHYNVDNSVNEKEIFKFKADNENAIFPTQFCLGCISNGLRASESKEISLKQMDRPPENTTLKRTSYIRVKKKYV